MLRIVALVISVVFQPLLMPTLVFGMMFFAFIGPFLGLPFVGFMVESKTWTERIKMALAAAFGYLIGSIITYFIVKQYNLS